MTAPRVDHRPGWMWGLRPVHLVLLAAVAGCDALLVDPPIGVDAPPAALTVALTAASVSNPDAAFERADALGVQIYIPAEDSILQDTVVDFGEGSSVFVPLDLGDRESVDVIVTVDLMFQEEPLFTGAGETTLTPEGPNQVSLDIEAQPAGLAVPSALPEISVLYDTVPIPGAALFASGDTITGAPIRWTSLNPDVVEVIGDTRMAALRDGDARLAAEYAGFADTAAVTVLVVVTSVTVEPGEASIALGARQEFTGRARDANGNAVPGKQLSWSSSNTAVVSVNQSGVATAIRPGSAVIQASHGALSGTANVNVSAELPSVATGGAGGVGSTGATVAGSANPRGTATEGWFEWGTDSGLSGSTATTRSALGNGTSTVSFEAALTGLRAGTTYYYRAVAGSSEGTVRGEIRSFTTGQVRPAVPAPASATIDTRTGGIDVRWTDRSANETSFQVQRLRADDDGSSWTTIVTTAANVTSHDDDGVALGGRYSYRIRACNSVGCSDYTDEVTVLLAATPTVRTGSATGVTESEATLNGTVNPRGASTVAWFEWGRDEALSSPSSTEAASVGAGTADRGVAEQIDDLGLETTYYFRTVARNEFGTVRGQILSFTTAGVPPAAPQRFAGAFNLRTFVVELSWADQSSDEERFELQRSSPNPNAFAPLATLAANTQSYIDQQLSLGAPYHYRLRACNQIGCSAWTPVVTVQTSGPPGVRTEPATGVGAHSAVFNGTVDPNGTDTDFWYEISDTGFEQWWETSSRSAGSGNGGIDAAFSYTDLPSNRVIQFRLVAENQHGFEVGEIESFRTLLPTPDTLAAVQDGWIYVFWPEVREASFYELYRAEDKPENFRQIATTKTDLFYEDRDFEGGRTYFYQVRACITVNLCSEFSQIAQITPGSCCSQQSSSQLPERAIRPPDDE